MEIQEEKNNPEIDDAKNDMKCPICLEFPTLPVATRCGHVFCWTCLKKWLDMENSFFCPLCNALIFEEEILKLYITDLPENITDDRPENTVLAHRQLSDIEELEEEESVLPAVLPAILPAILPTLANVTVVQRPVRPNFVGPDGRIRDILQTDAFTGNPQGDILISETQVNQMFTYSKTEKICGAIVVILFIIWLIVIIVKSF